MVVNLRMLNCVSELVKHLFPYCLMSLKGRTMVYSFDLMQMSGRKRKYLSRKEISQLQKSQTGRSRSATVVGH